MKRLLREPLVHFMALGLGLFLLFGIVGDSSDEPTGRIVVSEAHIARLAEVFARTWQRPPTEKELDGLIEEYIREEVYYREALEMGLDRDDTVVRRRLRQKLEFLNEDLVAAVEPDEEQLEVYLRENPDRFREPARFSFRQVYLSPERRGDGIVRDAEALRARLDRMPADADVAGLGDPSMLGVEHERVTHADVVRGFGEGFAAALDELQSGRWSGPVESGYGLHLVRIDEQWPAALPALADVRKAVEREWRNARQREAEEAFFRGLRERYEIVVERTEEGEDEDDGDGDAKLVEVRP